jgi:hypothetical protein
MAVTRLWAAPATGRSIALPAEPTAARRFPWSLGRGKRFGMGFRRKRIFHIGSAMKAFKRYSRQTIP